MVTDLSPQMAVNVQWIIPMKSSQSSAWHVGCVQTVQKKREREPSESVLGRKKDYKYFKANF